MHPLKEKKNTPGIKTIGTRPRRRRAGDSLHLRSDGGGGDEEEEAKGVKEEGGVPEARGERGERERGGESEGEGVRHGGCLIY